MSKSPNAMPDSPIIAENVGSSRLAELAQATRTYSAGDGLTETAITGLTLLAASSPTLRLPVVYSPSLCLIAQGEKSVVLGASLRRYAAGNYLAVSVELPVLGQVTRATPEVPFLCVCVAIDQKELAGLLAGLEGPPPVPTGPIEGLFVGRADAALVDCLLRLVRLLDAPGDIGVLAPMLFRELHYRLLRGDHGRAMAQLAVSGSKMRRIAEVIERLRNGLRQPLRVEDMAAMANMSVSSFHAYFKEVTTMSPLQFHKLLRLQEARRLLLVEHSDVAGAAYRVGYESPSQFSRDYSRLFGMPPGKDAEQLRHRGRARSD